MKDSVVIFGAGAVGRGFIAGLVAENGLTPLFVEELDRVVECC